MPDSPLVDGVSPVETVIAAPAAEKSPQNKAPLAMKAGLLTILAVPYLLYAFWCLFLLSALPAQGAPGSLITAGVITNILGAIAFLGLGALGFFRISGSKALPNDKMMALIKLGAFVVPGLLFSVVTPFVISGEPSYAISITSPSSSAQLIAPLSMSFSVQSAVDALAERGFKPIQYNWDINGDKKVDQQTLSPEITANYDKEGVYSITVSMKSADGSTKTASKRFIISRSVFSVTPTPSIIDRPVVFSLAHLYTKPEEVLSVAWDFDGDGTIDEENGGIQTSYTYLAVGTYTVTAVANLANKTQIQYQRSIDIVEPPALPFPVTLKAEPSNLIGTPPFAALFSIESDEPIYSVQWDFGDGQKAEGRQSTHTFTRNGSYAVVAKVRSESGTVAELSTVVKVVDRLELSDLRFEGTPEVSGTTITGEVPLTLDLTPITAKPFVTFTWEAPNATEVGSTDKRLQAIFRRAGTYTVTLVGQDLENHVLRYPIKVEVKDASQFLTFSMGTTVKNAAQVAPVDITFDASASTVDGIDGFVWNFGDRTPEKSCRCAIVTHTYESSGTFPVTVKAVTKTGVLQSQPQNIFIGEPELRARILPSRLKGAAPLTIEFDGSSSLGEIAEYLWDFGDNTQNDGPKVEHTFLDPGTYTVKLTVSETDGTIASSTVTITVQ